jgi:hypothetical protein
MGRRRGASRDTREKAGGVEAQCGRGRRGAAWSGRRKNRGEAQAQGGFRSKVKEIKRKRFFSIYDFKCI